MTCCCCCCYYYYYSHQLFLLLLQRMGYYLYYLHFYYYHYNLTDDFFHLFLFEVILCIYFAVLHIQNKYLVVLKQLPVDNHHSFLDCYYLLHSYHYCCCCCCCDMYGLVFHFDETFRILFQHIIFVSIGIKSIISLFLS